MLVVVRIVIGIVWVIFNFFIGEHDGKTITQRQLTKKEKQYVDFLQIYTFVSSMIIVVLLLCIIESGLERMI